MQTAGITTLLSEGTVRIIPLASSGASVNTITSVLTLSYLHHVCIQSTSFTCFWLCFRCTDEECSYYIAIDVLVQHDTNAHVCILLSPVCRAGFYKSTLGNMECSKCPPHSLSHHEGSLHCGCEKNYFRAEGDPVSMACTRKCVFKIFLGLMSDR